MGILEKFKLDGKTALVTGCRRGIGRAMAAALAEAGADVIGVSATLEPSGSDVEKDVTAAGRKFTAFACDFAHRKALHEFMAKVKADCAPVDILVNNAGTIERAPAAEHTDEQWDRVVEVNLNAQFVLAREFGKDMVARGEGKIIFTASLLTFQGGLGVPSYAAAKGGVGQLAMALSNEWAGKGVNVNAITPGYIATDLTAALKDDPARSKAILDRIPAGRWGRPDDLAGAVVFLASAASDYVNGTIVTIDGGWMGR
ncbi:MAG: SDR family NAD(P)-dependent oxidoreductase [Planctomycetota bacterium]|jgi:2-deoxy-D-gluconate 3-dehydrogenase